MNRCLAQSRSGTSVVDWLSSARVARSDERERGREDLMQYGGRVE